MKTRRLTFLEDRIRHGSIDEKRSALEELADMNIPKVVVRSAGVGIAGTQVSANQPSNLAQPTPRLKKAVVDQLEHDDPSIRSRAVAALRHWPDPDTFEKVVSVLNDKDERVKFQAIRVLPVLRPTEALQPLARVACDTSTPNFLRAYSLAALIWLFKNGPTAAQQPDAWDSAKRRTAEILHDGFKNGVPDELKPFHDAVKKLLRG